jgi:NADH-quinone oxidoreductase subunit E
MTGDVEMSVRRLAAEQPASFAFAPSTMEEARWWIAKYPPERKQSAVIPIMWLAQKQEGWVSEPAIRAIADLLGMPAIRVLEVATFYTMFHLAPVGKHHIQVCGTTPCMLRGAEDLKEACKSRIGPKHSVSADGRFSWEEVECLGACVNAPVAAIDDYYHEDLTADVLEGLLDKLARGEKIAPGSAIGRQAAAPEGGAKTLTDASLYDGSLAKPIRLPGLPEKV